jgi:protein-tyrosine phosphatase
MDMGERRKQGFVDIHTHLLFGVDDGAVDLQQSMELLAMARENGTTAVVMTPHHRGRFRKNTAEFLRQRFAQLQEQVKNEIPDMKLYLGNEAAHERELGDKVAEGRVLSLNDSNYVLLEFDFNSSRIQVMEETMSLIGSGYTPIIAHAERYDIFHKNKKLAEELLYVGALIQLNADSILGKCGFATKRVCHRLLKKGMVHFVASDAHDVKERPPVLKECFDYVSKRYGEDYAWSIFRDNALDLLTGKWR